MFSVAPRDILKFCGLLVALPDFTLSKYNAATKVNFCKKYFIEYK